MPEATHGPGVSDWSTYLSADLKLFVRVEYSSGIPTKFSFHLMGYIDGEWADLARIDNAHDETMAPHRHVFHPNRPEDTRSFVAALPESLVGWAEEHLKDHAQRYLDDYLRDFAAMNRGGPK